MKNILVTIGISFLIVMGYYVVKSYYLKPRLIQGQEAIEIIGELPDGNRFSLSDLRGKYVLLDFWGSWCGPCLESHPALVSLYERFHSQPFVDGSGFEIVSIAVENNDQNWKYVVRQDNLNWPYHLRQLQLFNSHIVKEYNVKQLPTKFLINPEGTIIGVDPSMNQVIKVLQSKLRDQTG